MLLNLDLVGREINHCSIQISRDLFYLWKQMTRPCFSAWPTSTLLLLPLRRQIYTVLQSIPTELLWWSECQRTSEFSRRQKQCHQSDLKPIISIEALRVLPLKTPGLPQRLRLGSLFCSLLLCTWLVYMNLTLPIILCFLWWKFKTTFNHTLAVFPRKYLSFLHPPHIPLLQTCISKIISEAVLLSLKESTVWSP